MAKRCATSDLNHDNWDREEPSESAGTFQRAGTDVIGKRIIKVAKRRSTGIASDESISKNAFSGFQGLKTDRPATDLKSTFSFLSGQAPVTNGELNPSTMAGSTTSSFNNPSTSQNSHGSEADKMYPAKLIRLNQCVANWIKKHVDEDPSCILTPIFKDYERYLKEIEEERSSGVMSSKVDTKANTPVVTFSNINSPSGSVPVNNNFKFNLPTGNKNDKKNSPGNNTSAAGSTLFSSFKTDGTKSPNISTLLSKPDQKTLMINPFANKLNKSGNENDISETNKIEGSTRTVKFSESSVATPVTTTGFVFGSGKILAFGNSSSTSPISDSKDTKDNDNGQTEESEEPPKVEFVPFKEEDAVFSKRCKMFIKREGNYADLGVTTLYIKPVTGEKHQLIVRADTSLGNILVNVLLNSAIPVQRLGKNNVMIICVPIPPAAGSTSNCPGPSTVLLRVKTGEEADELFSTLEKYKNKL